MNEWQDPWSDIHKPSFFSRNGMIILSPLLFIFKFYWSIVDLHQWVNSSCVAKWFSYTYIYIYIFFFLDPIEAYGASQARGPQRHSLSNTGSLTHWARPGIKPPSSRMLVGFINCWATTGASYLYIIFHILSHYGLSQDSKYSSLCSTVGPCCVSILYIIVWIC